MSKEETKEKTKESQTKNTLFRSYKDVVLKKL